jgi:hypothetical protein
MKSLILVAALSLSFSAMADNRIQALIGKADRKLSQIDYYRLSYHDRDLLDSARMAINDALRESQQSSSFQVCKLTIKVNGSNPSYTGKPGRDVLSARQNATNKCLENWMYDVCEEGGNHNGVFTCEAQSNN